MKHKILYISDIRRNHVLDRDIFFMNINLVELIIVEDQKLGSFHRDIIFTSTNKLD